MDKLFTKNEVAEYNHLFEFSEALRIINDNYSTVVGAEDIDSLVSLFEGNRDFYRAIIITHHNRRLVEFGNDYNLVPDEPSTLYFSDELQIGCTSREYSFYNDFLTCLVYPSHYSTPGEFSIELRRRIRELVNTMDNSKSTSSLASFKILMVIMKYLGKKSFGSPVDQSYQKAIRDISKEVFAEIKRRINPSLSGICLSNYSFLAEE